MSAPPGSGARKVVYTTLAGLVEAGERLGGRHWGRLGSSADKAALAWVVFALDFRRQGFFGLSLAPANQVAVTTPALLRVRRKGSPWLAYPALNTTPAGIAARDLDSDASRMC
jgi:hypothetical protein